MLALLWACSGEQAAPVPATGTGTGGAGGHGAVGGSGASAGAPFGGGGAGTGLGGGSAGQGGEAVGWRSELYPEDWTPELTLPGGWFLHDFSHAGYRASEEPIPDVVGPIFDVTSYGADATGAADSTASISAAIGAASATGGVVWFPAGEYRIDDRLTVASSNVVLRGAGSDATFLRFTRSAGMNGLDHLSFVGTLTEGTDLPLALDGASRERSILLESVAGLTVGDRVHLGWVISDEFVAEHDMDGTWQSFNGQWRPFFRRTITAIDAEASPPRVELDVPLRYAAKVRDGASLRRVSGYLQEVGLERLALTTVASWSAAWSAPRSHAVALIGVQDGWAREVVSYAPASPPDSQGDHLMSGGIYVLDSRRVTVTDCYLAEAQHRGSGGAGYLYEISRSSEILVRDSVGRAGRHNFIQNWDFGTSGCVWLRTESRDGRALGGDWDPVGLPGLSEYHHSLAMANLVDDSVANDGWQAVNRHDESSGAGHTATECVFWRLGTPSLRSFQFGRGYVIGVAGQGLHTDPTEWAIDNPGQYTEPADWVEGTDQGADLVPSSLFEDQLQRRLALR